MFWTIWLGMMLCAGSFASAIELDEPNGPSDIERGQAKRILLEMEPTDGHSLSAEEILRLCDQALSTKDLAQSETGQIHFRRALALAALDRRDEGKVDLAIAAPLCPAQFDLQALNIFASYGKGEAAARQLSALLKLHPESSSLITAQATVSLVLGQLDEAKKMAERGIHLDPKNASAHYVHGFVCFAFGEGEAALASANQAIALLTGDALVARDACFEFRGTIHRKNGELEQALSDFQTAYALNPHNAFALMGIGWVHHEKGRKELARLIAERVVALLPVKAEAFELYGCALADLHVLDGATAAFREAARLDPKRSEPHAWLARLL